MSEADKRVYHSFRHVGATRLKELQVRTELIEECMGHIHQGQTMGRYAKKYPIKILYEDAICKLDFNRLISMEHLKASNWVRTARKSH